MKKNKVIIIYDDSRKTGQTIKSITGRDSFGETIFKRLSLKNRTMEILRSFDNTEVAEEGDPSFDRIPREYPVFLLFSDFLITDREQAGILIEKACYSDDIFLVMDRKDMKNDKGRERPAAVIYPDLKTYREKRWEEEKAGIIYSEAFTDLSDVGNFRQFITSGFDARFFNALSGDEYTVVKRSSNRAKIRAEYEYYHLLPENMRMWYVTPFDLKDDGKTASYTMERLHMTDIALRYVHGAIDEEEFEMIMKKLFFYISQRAVKKVSLDELKAAKDKLYVDKVKERIETLKKEADFPGIEGYIRLGTKYGGIDEIAERYFRLYEKISGDALKSKRFGEELAVGHGDLCFSNILYNKDANILKLIDPKGALKEEELYMDPCYDLCKLSHSICGSYDYFNSSLFELSLSEENELVLTIDSDNERYRKIFEKYLKENGYDPVLIRLYEASLFLSMLPLHIDRKKKVLGFIINAVNILDEIEKSV